MGYDFMEELILGLDIAIDFMLLPCILAFEKDMAIRVEVFGDFFGAAVFFEGEFGLNKFGGASLLLHNKNLNSNSMLKVVKVFRLFFLVVKEYMLVAVLVCKRLVFAIYVWVVLS